LRRLRCLSRRSRIGSVERLELVANAAAAAIGEPPTAPAGSRSTASSSSRSWAPTTGTAVLAGLRVGDVQHAGSSSTAALRGRRDHRDQRGPCALSRRVAPRRWRCLSRMGRPDRQAKRVKCIGEVKWARDARACSGAAVLGTIATRFAWAHAPPGDDLAVPRRCQLPRENGGDC
jgi:hypothetical protein